MATELSDHDAQPCVEDQRLQAALPAGQALEVSDDHDNRRSPAVTSQLNPTPIAAEEPQQADRLLAATPAVSQPAIRPVPGDRSLAEILEEFHAVIGNHVGRNDAASVGADQNFLTILKLDPDEAIRPATTTVWNPNSEVVAVSLPVEREFGGEELSEAEIIAEQISISDEEIDPIIPWKDRSVGEIILEGDCSVRLSNCIGANPDFFSGWAVGRALANESEFSSALMQVPSLGRKTAAEALDALKAFALDPKLKEDEPPVIDPLSGFDPAKLDVSIRTALGGRHVSMRLANLLASGALDDLTVRDFFLEPDRVRARMLGCKNAGKKTVTEAFELLTTHIEALGQPDVGSASVRAENEVPEGLSTREWIEQAVSELRPNEVEVLHDRYGLGGESPKTLQEIAERVHVTRERVRQVEAKALRWLRTGARSQSAFKHYLAQEREAQWIVLFGTHSHLPENEVSTRFRKLDPWFLLAIDIVFEDGIDGYLGANAHRSDDGWFNTSKEAEHRQRLDRLLGDILRTYQTPMPLETLKEIAPSVVAFMSGGNDRCVVHDGYIFTGHVGTKARRTGRMHAVARRIASSGIFDIGTLIAVYRSEFPEDDCGSRMFEMQASEAPHLFAPLFDGIWLCLEHNSHQAALLAAPPFERGRVEETSFTEGSLGDLLVKQFEQFGPQRMIDLRRQIVDRSDGAFAISSVGAVVISNPCFRRLAPGIFGLYSGSSEASPTIDIRLLEERHCRLYCHARHSGAPQGYYPMWGAAYEMRLSRWAQRNAPTDLYRSLMAVIEPETWPVPPEIIAEFARRRRLEGRWRLGASRRLPFGNRFLDSQQFFSVLTHLVVFGWISWIGVNRATGSKSDNHDAADVLAFLVMTGLVEPESDWQAPHRPTDLAKRLSLEGQSERHLYGDERMGGEDVFGRLRRDLYDAPPTASRGWVDAGEFRDAMPAWRADGISTGRAFGGSQAREPGINAEESFESDDWNSVFGD